MSNGHHERVVQRRRPRRRSSSSSSAPVVGVAFDEQVSTVIAQPSPLETIRTPEEWSAVWYGSEEIECFRAEAREVCRRMRLRYNDGRGGDDNDNNEDNAAPQPPPSKQCSLAFSDETRGLEQRYCTERQRRKYVSLKYIIRASREKLKGDAERLGALSRKCNRWAAALALEEGKRDYVRAARVHQISPIILTPVVTTQRNDDNGNNKKKRCIGDRSIPSTCNNNNNNNAAGQRRRVRRRVSTDDDGIAAAARFVR